MKWSLPLVRYCKHYPQWWPLCDSIYLLVKSHPIDAWMWCALSKSIACAATPHCVNQFDSNRNRKKAFIRWKGNGGQREWNSPIKMRKPYPNRESCRETVTERKSVKLSSPIRLCEFNWISLQTIRLINFSLQTINNVLFHLFLFRFYIAHQFTCVIHCHALKTHVDSSLARSGLTQPVIVSIDTCTSISNILYLYSRSIWRFF